MKRTIIYLTLTAVFAISLAKALSPTDDTAALQALFSAGNTTLTAGHTYTVSGTLTITHAVNMNGATINSVITGSSVPVIKLSANGASITNGSITGPWLYTSAGDPTGYYGIRILADNVIIDHINLSQFSSYGIFCGPYNNPIITYCNISKTGFIGYYYDSEANTTGGTFSNNTVDRSMLASTTINQGCVQIRASTASTLYSSIGWTISNNIIKMPYNPWNTANECMELRHLANCIVSGNLFNQGSIGASIVACTNMSLSHNRTFNQSAEGIEFADCSNSSSYADAVNGSLLQGILLDGGGPYCSNISLLNDTVQNITSYGILSSPHNISISIIGCVIKSRQYGVYLNQTSNTTITGTTIDCTGATGTSYGIFENSSPVLLTVSNTVITNCTYKYFAYDTRLNQVVDNIAVYNSGVSGDLHTNLTNGAHLGTNVVFQTGINITVHWPSVSTGH